MEALFTNLTHAVSGSPLFAISAAFVWGILSVVLSPCHLASIPLIVGFIDGQKQLTTSRAFLISSLFAIGILITITALGIITAAAGRMLGDVGSLGNWFVATIFFLVGLHLLGFLSFSWSSPDCSIIARKGMLSALLLGLVFGVALGPCTFAFMAPVLGVVFNSTGTGHLYAATLLVAYGLGHCVVIVAAGTFTEVIQRYLNWNQHSKGTALLRKVCGLLVILGGFWMIYMS